MTLVDFSCRRPIAVTSVMILLALLGVLAFFDLGVGEFPDVEIPYVSVLVDYPGASPEEMELDVARVLEDAVGTLDNLKFMKTACMENRCRILLEFRLGTNVDVAEMEVRGRIDSVRKDLPSGCETPEILKFDPDAIPVATIVLTGDLPLDTLYDYADETLKNRLSRIPGVAEIRLSGGEELELHVELDGGKLAAVGLNVLDVIRKIGESNVRIPVGRIRQGIQEISVTYDSEFKNLEEAGSLEIGTYRKKRVYLRDVAKIFMSSSEKRTLAFYDGKPCVMLQVVKKGEANTVRVIDAVRVEVADTRRSSTLPGGMKLIWERDSGAFIKASAEDAAWSIVLGIVLTAGILWIFLRDPRTALVAAFSMPFSILCTFGAMKLCDFTFNTFTLLALGTSVGVLVTNSIVVLERIARRREAGGEPAEAVRNGGNEAILPVLASALTNVAVFLPVALMTGLMGRFLIPFAVTMAIATLCSLLLSFTMTPVFALLLSGVGKTQADSGWVVRLEAGFVRSLGAACAHPGWTVFLLVLSLTAAGIAVWPKIGMTFVPESDRNEFSVKLEFPTDYSLASTTRRVLAIEKDLRRIPGVKDTAVVIGRVTGAVGQVSEGVFLAEIHVMTVPKGERNASLDELRTMLRNNLSKAGNCTFSVNIPSSIGGSSSMLEMELSGDQLEQLEKIAGSAAGKLRGNSAFRDVESRVRPGKPEIRLRPDRAVLQNLELSSSDIGQMLRGSVDGIRTGTYKRGSRSYDLRVKLREAEGYRQFSALSFQSNDGQPRSLDAVALPTPSSVPVRIDRTDRRRTVRLFANPRPGLGLAELRAEADALIRPLLPAGYTLRFAGQAERLEEANADFFRTVIFAAVLTFLVLAALLESWSKALLILCTAPSAGVGMLLALFFTGLPLSIFGLLGLVMLIGISVNNAILLLDNVEKFRESGMNASEAMTASAGLKFRPVLMSGVAAVLGVLPMAFGVGIGSETRAGCGVGVIGGIVVSMIFALYGIPALYVLFSSRKKNEPGTESKQNGDGFDKIS